MTRIEVAPDLVEEAVFLRLRHEADRQDTRALAWFDAREKLYELKDPAARDHAFREHALQAFRALHFDEVLRTALEACATARGSLDTLYVRRARRTKEEAAELYCAQSRESDARATRAVLAVRPERFSNLEALFEFARRELLYVDDMLDTAFGYAPDAIDRLALDPGMRDVVRERVSREWKRRVERRCAGESAGQNFADLVQRAVASLGTCSAPLADARVAAG